MTGPKGSHDVIRASWVHASRVVRDDEPGIRAADDPDIDMLAAVLIEKRGHGRADDLDRRREARRWLPVIREFLNRTTSR